MPKQKYISDTRMLQVMEYWQEKAGGTQLAFCEKIGIHQGNIPAIRNGSQSFQIHHIMAAMKLIGGNYNYIFGAESNMLMPERKVTPLQQLDLAVKAVKEAYGKK